MSKKILSYNNDNSSYSYFFKNNHSYTKVEESSSVFHNFSFLTKIDTLDTPTYSVVFPGLRYLDDSVIIFERPPFYQNIFITPSLVENINDESEVHSYRIPIPWQVYVIEYNSNSSSYYACDVRMFFRNSSLTSLNDPVYLPPLTNFYADASLCRPSYTSQEDVDRYSDNINGVIQEAYDWIWNSGTNLDLTVNPTHYMRTCVYNDDFHRNSVLKHSSTLSFSHTSSTSSFFTSYESIQNLFNSWSRLDLSEVCTLSWMYPFTEDFKSYFSRNFELRMSSIHSRYFSNYDSSECCDDCQYYDEDGELVQNECSYEDCSCHSEPSMNYRNIVSNCINNNEYHLYDVPVTLKFYYDNIINPNLRVNMFNTSLFLDSLSYYSS
jgi:hypothetical protein